MNKFMSTVSAAAFAALAGCFTVHHSEYPQTVMSRAPEGKDVAVQISGFEATVVKFIPIQGYTTAWHHTPGFYDRHGYYHHGFDHPETISTTTYIPQENKTTVFAERAASLLEDNGYLLNSNTPDYRVDVKFTGPEVNDGDRTAKLMWVILSALSADYGAETWRAELRIYDVKTGRVLFHNNYTEKYTAAVWGPIPLFSPAGSDQTDHDTMQSWALSALTERTMAEATAFLSQVKAQ